MAVRKWGAGTLVNTCTAGDQRDTAVTTLADGGCVGAWEEPGRSPILKETKPTDMNPSSGGNVVLVLSPDPCPNGVAGAKAVGRMDLYTHDGHG